MIVYLSNKYLNFFKGFNLGVTEIQAYYYHEFQRIATAFFNLKNVKQKENIGFN